MATGNAVEADARDLSMRPKEYWETRPSPAKPHHWTAEEYAAHLGRHKYPSGTIEDRMRTHVVAIRKALMRGDYVPAVVMGTDEGLAALQDAITEVKSLDEGAFRSAQQKYASSVFDNAISSKTIESVVISGVKSAAQAKGAEPQPLVIENYPRPVWCVVEDDRVRIKDTGWNFASLYGTVHEVDKGAAEAIVRKAILDGDISFDDSLWFMGSNWAPFGVVQSCTGPGDQHQTLASQWKAQPGKGQEVGRIVALSDTEVIQDAGRQRYVSWDRKALQDQALVVGEQVTITGKGVVQRHSLDKAQGVSR